jgi:ketosteroid isomerase-like protein
MTEQAAAEFLKSIQIAMNDHDLDRLVAMFHPEYRSVQPVHPERSFQGRERVRENWKWVFERFPDFRVDVTDFAAREKSVWSEWVWTGTDSTGKDVEVRGVMIFEIEDELICSGRLYLEPVDSA